MQLYKNWSTTMYDTENHIDISSCTTNSKNQNFHPKD